MNSAVCLWSICWNRAEPAWTRHPNHVCASIILSTASRARDVQRSLVRKGKRGNIHQLPGAR
eukprot:483091-Pleurochrysis_carterae.AAC.1